MLDVTAYIDGFNLYNGLRDAYKRKYLWLDLEALCRSLTIPGQRLSEVKYFTAPVRQQPDSLRRQQTYWNALAAHCTCVTIERGRFQKKTVTCHKCHRSWSSFEEKETDVAIAVALVEDAARHRFDAALVVSADSDLCPAVRAVRRLHPSAAVVAAFPPARRSGELGKAMDATFTIAERKLKAALLPATVTAPDGAVLRRPTSWR